MQDAHGHALAVATDDGTTALISVGGADDATIYEQRSTDGGTPGPATEITTVADSEDCRPVRAATALANFAVAVECQARTGLEDPPTRLLELVWTGDDGWVWHLQAEGVLGSLDYSPGGQYVVFTSNSQYGDPHHVTSYHADLGWRDLQRRELGSTGDDLVAAIDDGGDVVALRGAGFEDEPGYWFGGRLGIETYSTAAERWTQRFQQKYHDGGIDPMAIDLSGGRIVATVVRSRSTGQVEGRSDKVVVLTGRPAAPRLWSSPRWSREILAAPAATTRADVGVAAWQERTGRLARSWFATWAPDRDRPTVWDPGWRTTMTTAASSGRTLDLSVSANGHGAIAYVRHRPGTSYADVAGASFRVGPHGRVHQQVDATWQRPPSTTVDVTASATSSSVTLGRIARTYYVSPVTRYAVCCAGGR